MKCEVSASVEFCTFMMSLVLNSVMSFTEMQAGTSRNSEQVVLDYYNDNLHCALHNRRVELDYLRQFADRAFPFVLPPLALDCR